ncbi:MULTISPECIES: ABC transporter ATP-binding protein [Clostridium]|uniref:ABC transporter ATP-binding protein n=1 Tax=Clostridium cibarium TaxID=2762247 RepID=A0ABR8PXL3_9CLOT|nr:MULTISPECIES: ABC transporter ATP-binding protein [Clostridium]MBD7912900.1 ABC transporter ATP-binding protein [Clostridium cibarium]
MKKYIFKFKGLLATTILLVSIDAVISVAISFMLKYIIDLAEGDNINIFFRGVVLLGAYTGVSLIFKFALYISKAIYIRKTMTYLKNDMFSNILNKDIKTFNEQNSANYISLLTNDVNMLEQDCFLNMFNLINYLVSFIAALISAIYLNLSITIAILVLALIAMFIPKLFGGKLSSKKKVYSRSLEELTSKTKDILSGFEVVRNFNIFSKAKKMYNESNSNVEIKKQEFSIYNGIVDCCAEFLGILMFIIPLIFGGYLLIKKEITMGTLIGLIQLMNYLSNPVVQSIQIINKIKSLTSISEKINSLATGECEGGGKYELTSFEKNIEFKDVSFSYDGSKLALENVNIEFEKGKKYAIVGGSGSGKSTIVKLILGYYNDFKGQIFIDGINNEDIKLDDIYKHISVIQQNVFMFDGTIKDNVTLYQDYSDEEIMDVIEKAGLSNLIERLPNGIYEEIGENGGKLSGGEKQRIAIARSLIKKSSIMLLDESTSALDNETAYSIEKSLLHLEDVTLIVITHKLMEDTLKDYDEIIAVNAGNVIETGDFYSLINKKEYFYSLYYVAEGCE